MSGFAGLGRSTQTAMAVLPSHRRRSAIRGEPAIEPDTAVAQSQSLWLMFDNPLPAIGTPLAKAK
jgi:hypothetical protein